MKKILIIGLMVLTSASLPAISNGIKINTLLLRINTIAAKNGANTKLDKLEIEKLSSYVQNLQKYEDELNLDARKTLYLGKTILYNNELNGRNNFSLLDEDKRRVEKLLDYMRTIKKEYNYEVDKNFLVEEVRQKILFDKESKDWGGMDLSTLQTIFECDVNDLENTAPEFRIGSSDFEEKVERTQFLQGMLISFLDTDTYKEALDIDRMLDYCKRLLAVADLIGPNENNKYMVKKYAKDGYLQRITQDLLDIERLTVK